MLAVGILIRETSGIGGVLCSWVNNYGGRGSDYWFPSDVAAMRIRLASRGVKTLVRP